MKTSITRIFAFLVLICGLIVIYVDIIDLWNTKDQHTVNVDFALETLEVSHRLNVLIPIGKEHYFLALKENENGIDGYIVRGSTKWHKTSFNESGYAVSTSGAEIAGLSKELKTKYQTRIHAKVRDIEGILQADVHFPLGEDHYIDLQYKPRAIFKLITLLLILLEIVMGIVIAKRHIENKTFLTGYLIAVILTIFLFIGTIFISM